MDNSEWCFSYSLDFLALIVKVLHRTQHLRVCHTVQKQQLQLQEEEASMYFRMYLQY